METNCKYIVDIPHFGMNGYYMEFTDHWDMANFLHMFHKGIRLREDGTPTTLNVTIECIPLDTPCKECEEDCEVKK